MKTPEEKTGQHDLFAEKMLIAYVLREASIAGEADAFYAASAIVRAADFYGYSNGVLWTCFVALVESGTKIDPVTVGNYLVNAKLDEKVGGVQAIIDLWSEAPSAANVVHYAEIIREKSDLRQYLAAGKAIIERASTPGVAATDIAAMAESALFAIRDRSASKSRPIAKSIDLALEEWDRRKNVPAGEMCGIGTPWPKVNMLTGGLQAGELSILAARPSVGKTLVALNLIAHVCDRMGAVQFASLEQQDVELVNRWASCRAGINSMKFRDCRFTANEEQMLIGVTSRIATGWNLETTESGSQTVTSIVGDIRRRKRNHGKVDLAVIDYLGLIENDCSSRELRIYLGDMCRRLKLAAKDIGCHIMLLCQLNRNKEHRGPESEPQLSDLRDSGNIEEHADAVFMLHKPNGENEHNDEDAIEILIRKQRNGRKGKVTCVHAKKFFEVRELASGPGSQYGGAA